MHSSNAKPSNNLLGTTEMDAPLTPNLAALMKQWETSSTDTMTRVS